MFNKNDLIGNTPMIKINYKINGSIKYIYTKLEYYNLTGSIKDRVAYYIINKAKEKGILKDKMPIVEATSGNTGISLASIGKLYNHEVHIFMPDWASKERINLMKGYGAKVYLISREEGGFLRCVDEARKLAEEKKGFLANQFSNNDNFLAHYETTGKEIIEQLPEKVGGFVSGVGTGGTLMGIGKRLKEEFKELKITAIEPDKMPIISGGEAISNHKIEGIGDDFIPDIVDLDMIDDIILISDLDAINMSKKIAKELGIGVGISSGANMIASVLLRDMGYENVATVFPDDLKKYLSTDLSKDIKLKSDNISSNIELIDYEIIK